MKNQERIESYILGKLSPEESLLFQAEMLNNPPLKAEHDSLKKTIESLNSKWIREDIMEAQVAWKIKRMALRAGILVLGTALFLVGLIKLNGTTHGAKVTQKAITHGNERSNESIKIKQDSISIPLTNVSNIVKPKNIPTQSLIKIIEIDSTYVNAITRVTSTENADTVFAPEIQTFYINNKIDNYIESESGLRIFIPALSLLNPYNHRIIGQVKIELEDYFGYYNMYKHKITTTSNNRLLESGGSCYIRAFSDHDELTVDPEKQIFFLFPTLFPNTQMHTFYGEKLPNGELNWNEQAGNKKTNNRGGFNEAPNTTQYIFRIKLNADDFDIEGSTTEQEIINYLTGFNNLPNKIKKEMLDDSLNMNLKYFVSNTGELSGFEYEKHVKGNNPKKVFSKTRWRKYDRRSMRFGRQLGDFKISDPAHFNTHFSARLKPEIQNSKLSDTLEIISEKDNLETKIRKENHNYNIITSRDFGYINCDHFKDGNLINISVPVINSSEEVRIFFSQFNAAAVLQTDSKTATFNNVPDNEPIKMICIRRNKDGSEMSLTSTRINRDILPAPYQPYSLEKIREFLEPETPLP